MLLAIDIGNTTISLAVMEQLDVISVAKISSNLDLNKVEVSFTKKLKQLTRTYNFEYITVCSVVPNVLKIVKSEISQIFSIRPYIIGENLIVPIKNHYTNPKQVGRDRLVGAYAASQLYGVPAIVIDLGTAITFDAISAKGEYLGGIIVPGIRLSAESLSSKTALLPKIDIHAPANLIGRDTEESMLSGLFHGYGSLCEGIIKRLSKELGGKPRVIMTGGHTELMKQFIDRKILITDQNLVFKGLSLLVNRN